MSTRAVVLLAEDCLSEVGELIANLWICVETFGDPLACVKDGGVIAPAECRADRRQRCVRELPREVDRDLSRPCDPGCARR